MPDGDIIHDARKDHDYMHVRPVRRPGVDDLFRGFFSGRGVAPRQAVSHRRGRKDGAYVVNAEIPGVAKDEIQVSIEGNQVTIGAEVKRETEKEEGERVLHSERYFGSAYRSFTLPSELDEAASTAKYENGVLELKLAKKAVAGRKLTIQ